MVKEDSHSTDVSVSGALEEGHSTILLTQLVLIEDKVI